MATLNTDYQEIKESPAASEKNPPGESRTHEGNDQSQLHQHTHAETHEGGAAHGSVKEYVLGLILSIVLTMIPFGLVMGGYLSEGLSIALILLCAIGQIMVQLIFFLHMNGSSDQMWNTMSMAFTVVLVAILIVGSVWIMNHLNHNMLLGH